MTKLIFYIVDVFAEEKFAGNQLAVVTGADALSTSDMQRIASEMHFSETTFLLSDQVRKGGYDVRIFTPSEEVPFAGHPTLGTAYLIKRFIASGSKRVVLNLKVGPTIVDSEVDGKGDQLEWMEQMPPKFGKIYDSAKIANMLGLKRELIDNNYPVQEVSTGLPFIIVPLKNLKAVKKAKFNVDRLPLTNEIQVGILVFCPETYKGENDLNVRVFAECYGIFEDPATGSANGCLAGYLSNYEYFGGSEVDISIEQGFEIGRPSLIRAKAENKLGKIQVKVGGKVVLVAKGEFL
jgi:trans-2,3-dihydro-3-hydroxyanthranilate isomerase